MAGPVSHLPVRNESAPREDFARKSKSPHTICQIPESVKVAPTLARWGSHHGFRIPFTRRGPSHPRTLPRFPATMASSDSSLRFRAPACAPFGFGLRRRFPSSSALRCIPARPPKFLTERSRRVVLLCPARALAVGFAVASGDLPSGRSATISQRKFVGLALRRGRSPRPTGFDRSRHFITGAIITSRFVCDSCSFHHDRSAKPVLAYQTLLYMFYSRAYTVKLIREFSPKRRGYGDPALTPVRG